MQSQTEIESDPDRLDPLVNKLAYRIAYDETAMELERLLIAYWTDEDREGLGERLLRTAPSEGHVREVFEVALARRLDTDPLDLIRESLFGIESALSDSRVKRLASGLTGTLHVLPRLGRRL